MRNKKKHESFTVGTKNDRYEYDFGFYSEMSLGYIHSRCPVLWQALKSKISGKTNIILLTFEQVGFLHSSLRLVC